MRKFKADQKDIDRIILAIKISDLKQKIIADKLGVTEATLSNFKRRKRALSESNFFKLKGLVDKGEI